MDIVSKAAFIAIFVFNLRDFETLRKFRARAHTKLLHTRLKSTGISSYPAQ